MPGNPFKGVHPQSASSADASTSSAVRANPGAGWRQIQHRASSSIDRSQYAQQPQGNLHPSYSNSANVPDSPGVHQVATFPSGYSLAGYSAAQTSPATDIGKIGMGRFHPQADDAVSINSLAFDDQKLLVDNDQYSDSGHSFMSLKTPPSYEGRTLRQKTSFTHLKDSDHKIPSNQETYNAYIQPGVPQYEGPEKDDAFHDPGPRLKGIGPDRRLADSKVLHGSWTLVSWRGLINVLGLVLILGAIVFFFAGWPVISYIRNLQAKHSASALHTNGTGQVPDIAGFRGLIDKDTPNSAYTKTGADGQEYTLVFSDEFNTDGRTFYDGDDPYWTAVDMYYYSTGDLEYYNPQSVTTQGGYLVINLTQVPDPTQNHNLNYMSGMLQSWNQLCFTGGIVEASASIPGANDVTGLWPAFWTIGNLGRAGYGSSLDGMWPYSYDSCDSGTLKNQTNPSTQSTVWQTSDGYDLSYLPGQRASACTCKGEDHPGPSVSVGRSAPELDVFEALINPATFVGEVSQTMQVAPFDMDYLWSNTTGNFKIETPRATTLNDYHGGHYQQSCSALSLTNPDGYYLQDPTSFHNYSVEYKPSKGDDYDGYMYWKQDDKVNWMMNEAGLQGNKSMDYSQRLVPREPMYMVLNLGMAETFNPVDKEDLTFPAIFRIDYIRVYQHTNEVNIGCDPPGFPTADYIQRHINAYTDYNLTVWEDADPSGFPKNSLVDQC